MVLDSYLPDYDAGNRHAVEIRASPERVFAALRALSAADLPLFRLLMTLRGLPATLLRGRRPDPRGPWTAAPLVETMQRAGFRVLEEVPGRALVVGAVGRFWRLRGPSGPRLDGAAAFRRFATPGFAKAAVAFWVEPLDPLPGLLPGPPRPRVRLRTETRVRSTDAAARRRFGRYWRVIAPGSALIRREWLQAIKRRAEAPDPPPR